MSINFNTDGATEIAVKITDSAATTVVDAGSTGFYVHWLSVSATDASATPSLTVALFDGTDSYALGAEGSTWSARTIDRAKQSLAFDDIVVPAGWSIQVTSNHASGLFDVTGTKAKRVSSGAK